MAKAVRNKKIGNQFRSFELVREKIDKEKRTVELSFSSEAPVERWWGTEVLDHDGKSCDLSRLNNAAPLLLDHDSRNQIGVVEKSEIRDKRGYATVRFSKTARAEEIFADVMDGIRGKVSVGYSIRKMQMEEMDGDPDDGDDSEATYRATDWMPYELSLVSIPADDSVGVGRASNTQDLPETSVIISDNMFRTHPSLKRDAEANPDKTGGGAESKGPEILDARNSEKNRIQEITAMGSRFRKIKEAEKAIETDMSVDAFRKQLIELIESAPDPEERSNVDQQQIATGVGCSVGEAFVRGSAYQGFLKTRGKGTQFKFDHEVTTLGVSELRNWIGRGAALGSMERTAAGSTGLTSIQKLPSVIDLGVVPMRVADLFMPGETGNTTVRYIQENTFTNAAAALAEEGTYAENTWDLSEVDAAVRKIGVLGRLTDELIADYPAVRSYIDMRLAYGVGIKEDAYLLSGTGANNQIKGILNFAGIQTQPYGGSGDTVPDALFKALVKVRTVGWAIPTAFIMHPTDWGNLRLTKDKNGQYLYGGPSTGPYGYGPYTVSGFVWGLPVVETTSISQGTVLTGAFNQDAQIFRRLGLVVETTNTDASDFANGRIAIRVTERLAFACYRPVSFCTVTGIPAA